ncbi:hypothetical protein V8J82_21475 [Gymnodinialimonas sp. 2305UL16-5]|uniref:hypothetical protein n=1 Tax=Gymnodinialimonas mytili TaxID=3126503 RepID=UPI0030A675FF
MTLLVLELLDAGERRLVQRGQSFTMGTFPGATWPLPATPGAANGGEVRVQPDGVTASIALVRGSATLDQRALTEEPRTLSADAIIIIGPHRIAARFRDDLTIAHATEAPTISAILADVAPGGITASSPVPARAQDDWIGTLTGDAPETGRPDWNSLGRYTGQPKVTEETHHANPLDVLPSGSTFLPDDWDADPVPGGAASSDLQDRLVQSRAPGHVLPGGAGTTPRPAPQHGLDPGSRAFLTGAGLLGDDMADLTPDDMGTLGALLREALDGLARLEQEAQTRATDIGLPAAATGLPREAIRFLLGAVQLGDGALAQLDARITDLARMQAATHDGARLFAAEARKALDPDTIRAETARGALRLGASRAAWALYETRFAQGPASGPPPLSDQALAAMISARLHGVTPVEDTKEEPSED